MLGLSAEIGSTCGFARAFIETTPISAEDKSKFAHLNAERLLLARASSSKANARNNAGADIAR